MLITSSPSTIVQGMKIYFYPTSFFPHPDGRLKTRNENICIYTQQRKSWAFNRFLTNEKFRQNLTLRAALLAVSLQHSLRNTVFKNLSAKEISPPTILTKFPKLIKTIRLNCLCEWISFYLLIRILYIDFKLSAFPYANINQEEFCIVCKWV